MKRTVPSRARAVVIPRDPARHPRGPPGCAAGPTTRRPGAASIAGMTNQQRRLAGSALVAGGALAIAGYLLAGTLTGSGDARFTDPLWQPLYAIALAGNLLVVLGFPAVLTPWAAGTRG